MHVYVYWNFNKKLWSIRSLESGRVIGWLPELCLSDVTLKVSEAGRQRVLRERRKNVHAGVVGYLIDDVGQGSIPVTYNPYKYDSFVNRLNLEPIHSAKLACMSPNGTVMVEA